MIKKIFNLLMLSALSTLCLNAYALDKVRHVEKLKSPYGMVQFFLNPGYPIVADTMAFMSNVHHTQGLEVRTHIRGFTREEVDLVAQGINPFQSVVDDIPENILKDKKWQERHLKQIKPYRMDKMADATLGIKYNIQPEEYPLFLYFAPSGNMYKFPMPAWRSKPHRIAFWNTLQKETRFKRNSQSGWEASKESFEQKQSNQTEEDLNKKRLFTIK